MTFPQMFRIRQKFSRPRVENVAAEVAAQLAGLRLEQRIHRGQSVAITAGSRGIAGIATIVRACADSFRAIGARPFVVPAMGSHGGATAKGQSRVLATYGITEAAMGCPIRSGMETVVVGQAAEGFPIHFDRQAYEADHVLVVNRVKPHTDFSGDLESGLMKMLLIGLGKHAGAKMYHRAVRDYSFQQIARSVGPHVLANCRIVGGLGIVENAYDETARILAVTPREFIEREVELLVQAKQWMARLPFDRVDLLVIDEIGKNISGTGLDTNVVGRKSDVHQAREHEWPKVRRIYVRDLTPETHGNATGIGCAEFCHRRVVDQMDVAATRINCLTSGRVSVGMLPFDYPNDRLALEAAMPTIGLAEARDAKLLWIKNTLELEEVECSAAYWPEAESREDLQILSDLRALRFNSRDDLIAPPAAGKSPRGRSPI
jgi:hypothetical protein